MTSPFAFSEGKRGLCLVLRDYVTRIFSLPHAWGGTTHSGTLPLLYDSRDFSVGSSLSPHNTTFISHLGLRSWHFANNVLDAPSCYAAPDVRREASWA